MVRYPPKDESTERKIGPDAIPTMPTGDPLRAGRGGCRNFRAPCSMSRSNAAPRASRDRNTVGHDHRGSYLAVPFFVSHLTIQDDRHRLLRLLIKLHINGVGRHIHQLQTHPRGQLLGDVGKRNRLLPSGKQLHRESQGQIGGPERRCHLPPFPVQLQCNRGRNGGTHRFPPEGCSRSSTGPEPSLGIHR